jgi:hypothetical protein
MKTRKRRLIHLAMLTSLLVAALFVGTAAADRSSFTGVWYSTDIDGSTQRLSVGGGRGDLVRISFMDFGAGICGESLEYPAWAMGNLTVSGNVLSGNLPVVCNTLPPFTWGVAAFEYTYDAGTDTLTDWLGVVWHRGRN